MDQNNQALPVENSTPPSLSIGFNAVMSTSFSSNRPSRWTPNATTMKVSAKDTIPRYSFPMAYCASSHPAVMSEPNSAA